ncbi:MAG: hypothetical protein LBP59_19830 [Planctomycetaceae bacterium]|jgi:hypothetical protein|nr:hypothetical protein [Planctomycetaceae bacterium]
MNRVSLLLSHLPRQISGSDEPIKRLKAAIAFLRTQDVTIITSSGQTNWDCILAAALWGGIPVHLVLVAPTTVLDVSEQFNCEFNSYGVVDSCELRDKYICSAADCLYPIWLRRNGRISRIISDLPAHIDLSFDCSFYRFRESGLKYILSGISVEAGLLPSDYLWHWTRGRHDAWQGETQRNYCNDILNSESPPRNALATLIRILSERKIRASGLRIAGNIPVTSFTANHPAKSAAMFTWRTDWQRMNFEPYGIGIEKKYAAAKGAKLLNYGTTPDWDTMQYKNRWKNENEWRIKGDLLLDDEIINKIIVVVRKQTEIKKIKNIFNGKIIAYEKET